MRARKMEVPCLDGRKSFYGKAKAIIDVENNITYLKSYNTIVGYISKGRFHKTWDSYSQTTMRHIRSFCRFFGAEVPTKKQWDAMEIESVA